MNTPFDCNFCPRAMAWLTQNLPKASDKHCFITGPTSGIGWALCFGLGLLGAKTITLACRNVRKGVQTTALLQKHFPNTQFEYSRLDLSCIENMEQPLNPTKMPIDCLIHNAGVAQATTSDNLSNNHHLIFNVNHCAQHALTAKLMPWLKMASGGAVVVSTSSLARFQARKQEVLDYFSDANSAEKQARANAYANSKLANVYFSVALESFFSKYFPNLKARCVHPGLVFTNINQHALTTPLKSHIAGKHWNYILLSLAKSFGLHQIDTLWAALPALQQALLPSKPNTIVAPSRAFGLHGPPTQKSLRLSNKDLALAMNLWEKTETHLGKPFAHYLLQNKS